MKLLIYCYGPLNFDKNKFCQLLAKADKNVVLIEGHKIRKKITKSLIPQEAESEKLVLDEIQKLSASLFEKNKTPLINDLLLSKKQRLSLLSECKKNKETFKKVALCFSGEANRIFEKNQKDRTLKTLSFDTIRSQTLQLKKASEKDEADLFVNEVSAQEDAFKINARLWGEDRIISCKDYIKILNFFRFADSE